MARFAAGLSLGIVVASGIAAGADAGKIADDIHQVTQADEQYGAASPEYQQVAHTLNQEQASTLAVMRYPAFIGMAGFMALLGSSIAWRRAMIREAAQRPTESAPPVLADPTVVDPIPWMRPSDESAT